ncbi:hypothetical protein [Mucilaginibacter sp.]|uniref:hypothetical protein n=1 Tax=Mucilaginibacter sp. TaxID=1882438 RepID=UPI0035BC8D10
MAITNEQLVEIESFAGPGYMSKADITIICSLDEQSAKNLSDPKTDEGKAFLKGRLKRKAEFNMSVCRLSDQLSSPAQAIELKLSKDIFLNDKKQ